MIPVKQTKLRESREGHFQFGNCFPAVIASLLEKPIDCVPNVEVFYSEDANDQFWFYVMHKFLENEGLELMYTNDFLVFHEPEKFEKTELDRLTAELKDVYYIVSGNTIRSEEILHACIYQNGIMVHDPHPSNSGLTNYQYFSYIIPLK